MRDTKEKQIQGKDVDKGTEFWASDTILGNPIEPACSMKYIWGNSMKAVGSNVEFVHGSIKYGKPSKIPGLRKVSLKDCFNNHNEGFVGLNGEEDITKLIKQCR